MGTKEGIQQGTYKIKGHLRVVQKPNTVNSS